jgi:ribosomal protein S18 acetylase RimI-like enzyme
MTLSFRAATPQDVPAVVALVESAYRGEVSKQGWTTEADLLDGQRTDAAGVTELIEAKDSRIVLAERGAELLACANIARIAAAPGRERPSCYFGMFSVRPDLQGAGVGHALLAECERIAAHDWGCRSMDMTVIRQREELIAWYARRGYWPTGERKPFPYGDERFGIPKRPDLEFIVLAKPLP